MLVVSQIGGYVMKKMSNDVIYYRRCFVSMRHMYSLVFHSAERRSQKLVLKDAISGFKDTTLILNLITGATWFNPLILKWPGV